MAKRLEDFIKDYLKDKSAELGVKGYAKWLSERGSSTGIRRAEAITRADTSYHTSLSGYGKNAERLATAGLNNSGYAKYINTLTEGARKEALASADLSAGKSMAKDMKAYEDYLNQAEDDRLKAYENAVKSIKSDSITSYSQAYDKAVELGLDEESAKRAAKEASDSVKSSLRQKLLTEIATKRLTSEATRAYALTIGLDESIANELAEYAHRLNESVDSDGMSETYLDYLKNLLNKKG